MKFANVLLQYSPDCKKLEEPHSTQKESHVCHDSARHKRQHRCAKSPKTSTQLPPLKKCHTNLSTRSGRDDRKRQSRRLVPNTIGSKHNRRGNSTESQLMRALVVKSSEVSCVKGRKQSRSRRFWEGPGKSPIELQQCTHSIATASGRDWDGRTLGLVAGGNARRVSRLIPYNCPPQSYQSTARLSGHGGPPHFLFLPPAAE
ncbi:hypothetical protein BaRGS_00039270 [Batillaria attramentaria]|uniref:Uncharacterized protein n=1 Tax=Batillaria attramentaria TaxID=370345 RepID=A0ABD0J3Y2_9CAEN